MLPSEAPCLRANAIIGVTIPHGTRLRRRQPIGAVARQTRGKRITYFYARAPISGRPIFLTLLLAASGYDSSPQDLRLWVGNHGENDLAIEKQCNKDRIQFVNRGEIVGERFGLACGPNSN